MVSKFEECQRLVAQLGLFSTNESVEDIATGDLQYVNSILDCKLNFETSAKKAEICSRYITVDFLLADLLQKSYSADRMESLRRTREIYEKYLETLDRYGLLSPSDEKLYHQYNESPTTFSLTPMNDPAALRDVKISRLRDEKVLKQKLEV